MKKLLLFCILTFLISPIAFAQTYGWIDISANVPGDSLYHGLSDIYFVSDDEGWITSSSHAEIYHTTDGGDTFEIQTTQYSCNAIYMIDELEGYAGGENGRIYRTTDGGDNWVAIGTIGVTLTDLDFATTSQGYACGDNGAVYSVTAGGATSLNSGLGNHFSGISAPFIDNVWVCGGSDVYYYDGVSFTNQFTPTGTYSAISMLTNEIGWLAGQANGSLVAGCNGIDIAWTVHFDLLQFSEPLFDIFSLTSSKLWSVGVEGAIFHTSNGDDYGFDTLTSTGWSNVIWEKQADGLTNNFLRGVFFTSSTNGYVVGNNKTLLKYTQISSISEVTPAVKFKLFPNPINDKLKIYCIDLKTEKGTIEILALEGKIMMKKELAKGNENIEMDLDNLENGLYMIKITIDKRSSIKKIIKE